MDVGLFLNPQAPEGTDPAALVDDALAQTRAARTAGFDLLTTGQHYLADYVQLQLVPLLGRVAADAGAMDLATGVVLLPLHHPVEIAEQIATLDAIADGRVILGVGEGYRDVEFESFGVPRAERAPRLAEGVDLANRLWTEEAVSFDGEFYAVDGAGIEPRPGEKPPVWVAGGAPAAVERAARIGDAWFTPPSPRLGDLADLKGRYDAVRRENGCDTAIPIFREAFVAPTTAEAIETARPYLESKYARYRAWSGEDPDEGPSFDDLARDRFLVGTPAEVLEEIDRYRDLDPSHLVLRVSWPGLPTGDAIDCLELLGDEVLPHV